MKIGIIGIGHPFLSQYKALKKLGYEIILCDIDKEKLKKYPEEGYLHYQDLKDKVDMVLVSTPPKTHFPIIKYFLEHNIKVIGEKPIVTKYEDLKALKKMVNNNFYNVLHFSFGEEVLWFKENCSLKPLKIEVYINDPYLENKEIKKEAISLEGAYLDEVINPLSAIKKLYKGKLKLINVAKKYTKRGLDYETIATFKVGNIFVKINVKWNDTGNKEKYMDLYFKDKIIRLDSYNVKVIDLQKKKVLFQSLNSRMDKHYENAFKNIDFKNKNWKKSYLIHKELLKGVDP